MNNPDHPKSFHSANDFRELLEEVYWEARQSWKSKETKSQFFSFETGEQPPNPFGTECEGNLWNAFEYANRFEGNFFFRWNGILRLWSLFQYWFKTGVFDFSKLLQLNWSVKTFFLFALRIIYHCTQA